jgi:hypothetical protein
LVVAFKLLDLRERLVIESLGVAEPLGEQL